MTTPAVLAEFLTAVEDGVAVPENLRAILLGGSTVSRQLARRAEELLGCNIYNAFGSIETGGNTLARPATQDFEQGVIGTPFPWVDFNVESEDGSKLPLGEEGLLAVRVPPDCRITETLVGEHPYDKDGWFRSGDLGYELADGTMIFTGRKSDMINSSGSKVSPARYEELVLSLVAANEVTAFAIPNKLGSDDVGIAIVSVYPIDFETLQKALNDKVGTHLDFHIFAVDIMPINRTGKVDRKALLEKFG